MTGHALPPPLIGRRVRITWTDRWHPSSGRDPPWEVFVVLDAHGEWVRLQGADDPRRRNERQSHGKPFWIRASEIEEVEEMDDVGGDA